MPTAAPPRRCRDSLRAGHGVATTAVKPVKWTRATGKPRPLVALAASESCGIFALDPIAGDGVTTSMLKEFTGVCCCFDGLLP
jgi:hypothetical protein